MQEPQFYWIWELFSSDPLRLTPNQARYVMLAIEKKQQHVKIGTEFIATSAHKRLHQSDERIRPETDLKLLEDGAPAHIKPQPVYNERGAVMGRWAKRIVTEKEYKVRSFGFSKQLLGKTDNGNLIVAFVKTMMKPERHDPEVEWCTPEEVAILEKGLER